MSSQLTPLREEEMQSYIASNEDGFSGSYGPQGSGSFGSGGNIGSQRSLVTTGRYPGSQMSGPPPLSGYSGYSTGRR